MTDIKGVVDLADIDISHLIQLTISNPEYKGEEVNYMELGYNYPEDKKQIIGIIKMAVRCGLALKISGHSMKGVSWANKYYEQYKT